MGDQTLRSRVRVMSTRALLFLVAQLPVRASSAFIDPDNVDYGYWSANVSVSNTVSGARVCVVSAEYWAYPGVINQWSTLHDSTLGTVGYLQPASYDDLSFAATDLDGEGDQRKSSFHEYLRCRSKGW